MVHGHSEHGYSEGLENNLDVKWKGKNGAFQIVYDADYNPDSDVARKSEWEV